MGGNSLEMLFLQGGAGGVLGCVARRLWRILPGYAKGFAGHSETALARHLRMRFRVGRRRPGTLASRLADKPELSRRLQRLGIERADFGGAAYIEGYDQAVASGGGGDDPGAFR